MWKISLPLEFDHRIFQPVPSRYTEYAKLALSGTKFIKKKTHFLLATWSKMPNKVLHFPVVGQFFWELCGGQNVGLLMCGRIISVYSTIRNT
jgi:hypothetical protein